MPILLATIIALTILLSSLFTSSSILKSPAIQLNPTPTLITSYKKTAKVTYIFDGDTIQINGKDTVRLIGIDSPEIKTPYTDLQCYGEEAKAAATKILSGQTVTLESDISNTDKYGRRLRHVWLGDTLVGERLVAEGFARASAFPPDLKYQNRFIAAENFARTNNLGYWAKCKTPTQPYISR